MQNEDEKGFSSNYQEEVIELISIRKIGNCPPDG